MLFRVSLSIIFVVCLAGCFSASVTQSSGGGGKDAGDCISITNPESGNGKATVSNSCNVNVNFLEFSTGSQGLIAIGPMGEVQQDEFIFAWGACIAPAVPDRIEEFDYQCIT